MSPTDFIASVRNFDSASHADRIRYFAWYLEVYKEKADFTGADVSKCFKDASYPGPSSVSPFLGSLYDQKKLLKAKAGRYRLSHEQRKLLNRKLGQRPATVAVDSLLASLPSKIANEAERVYLDEALICFRHKAFRASIVMTWNLAFDHLCSVILSKHLAAFNTQLTKTYPKAKPSSIAARDDFGAFKESEVLQVAKSANIISNSIHKVLKEKLDRRNVAAHPSGVSIAPQTAEEFIIDLVNNVVLKF